MALGVSMPLSVGVGGGVALPLSEVEAVVEGKAPGVRDAVGELLLLAVVLGMRCSWVMRRWAAAFGSGRAVVAGRGVAARQWLRRRSGDGAHREGRRGRAAQRRREEGRSAWREREFAEAVDELLHVEVGLSLDKDVAEPDTMLMPWLVGVAVCD